MLKMRGLRAKLAAVAAVGVALAGANAYPAQANTSNPIANCLDGYVCFYDGTNYGTYRWTQFHFDYLGYSCQNMINGFDNVISSFIMNPTQAQEDARAGFSLKFYMNDNCSGTPVPSYPVSDTIDPDLTTTDWGNVSNAINSVKVGHS